MRVIYFRNYYVLIQRIQSIQIYSTKVWFFLEKIEINNLSVPSMCYRVMTTGTYERTNCVN